MRVTSLLQKVPAQGTQTREGSPLGKGTTVQFPAQAENQEHCCLPAFLPHSCALGPLLLRGLASVPILPLGPRLPHEACPCPLCLPGILAALTYTGRPPPQGSGTSSSSCPLV